MTLIHIISIDKMFMLTQGQGHKVKGQGHICRYVKINNLGYKSRANDWIVIKLMHRVDIDATLKVT